MYLKYALYVQNMNFAWTKVGENSGIQKFLKSCSEIAACYVKNIQNILFNHLLVSIHVLFFRQLNTLISMWLCH